MLYDKDELKKSLSIDEIIRVVRLLGSENEIDRREKGEIHFNTICHNKNEGSHKLYYYVNSQIFHCYTGCSESFDIFDLIIKNHKLKGINLNFQQAVRWLAEKTGRSFGFGFDTTIKPNLDLEDDWKWLNRFNEKRIEIPVLPQHDERVLDVFSNYKHYSWLSEGIGVGVMELFEIGFYNKYERITIPCRDINGRLIGIRGRATRDYDIENKKKYMPIKVEDTLYNHPTAYSLYGIHKTKEAIKRFKKAIIFEGEKSVLKAETFYNKNNFAVAVYGSNVSLVQREMLLNLGIEEVILAFDKSFKKHDSKEAYEYAKKIKKIAYMFSPYVRTYVLWDSFGVLKEDMSPIDNGQQILEFLLKNKYEISSKGESV